jgi:hypothetical protein
MYDLFIVVLDSITGALEQAMFRGNHAASSRRDRHQGRPRRTPFSSSIKPAGTVPSNSEFPPTSLLPLPLRAPELNSQENIWQFVRQNWLSNRVFKSFDDIVDHCCYAWNTVIATRLGEHRSSIVRDW